MGGRNPTYRARCRILHHVVICMKMTIKERTSRKSGRWFFYSFRLHILLLFAAGVSQVAHTLLNIVKIAYSPIVREK